MSSQEPSDPSRAVNLEGDVPTTADDVAALRRLREATPSWLFLSAAEIEALIPDGALDARPPTRAGTPPFTLP